MFPLNHDVAYPFLQMVLVEVALEVHQNK